MLSWRRRSNTADFNRSASLKSRSASEQRRRGTKNVLPSLLALAKCLVSAQFGKYRKKSALCDVTEGTDTSTILFPNEQLCDDPK